MRIAMFTNNYKPYIGGVPVSVEHLAKALRERGHTVYVFAPSYEGQKEEPFVIRYPSFPVKIVGAPVPNVLTGLFLKKVQELEIDIIHVHHPALVGNVALFLKRRLRIPVVFTYHTRYEEYLHYVSVLEKIEKHTGVIERYLRFFCDRCDMLAAPTPGIWEYLNEKGMKAPVGVLPMGIPEGHFHPDREAADALRRKYAKTADYLTLTVSRLAKEKNLMFQLQGLARLKAALAKRGRSFRHLMIGDGPDREALQKEAEALGLSGEIVLVGNVANEEIRNYQAACDLFLFTSKSETQGIVLLEAMAASNPVVAVEASGVCDLVRDGENGALTPEDADAWAAAAVRVLTDTENFRNMRRAARETAEEYSEAEVAARAELYYLNTCVRASGAAIPHRPNLLRKVPLWH